MNCLSDGSFIVCEAVIIETDSSDVASGSPDLEGTAPLHHNHEVGTCV